MDISFKNKRIEKICKNDREMKKHFDTDNVKKLQRRLTQLKAANHLGEISHLRPTRLHELDGNREGQLSVDMSHPHRLVFEPAHDPVPQKADGGLDRELVTAIKILEVGVDYHGK